MKMRIGQLFRRFAVFWIVAVLVIVATTWALGWRPFMSSSDRQKTCSSGTAGYLHRMDYGVLTVFGLYFGKRATCYTTVTIGRSVQGKPITAYQFGKGPERLVYIGGLHGNEANATKLMEQWRQELNASPKRIPAGRSIIIIPAANPDGLAANTRMNARQVDLNRNFPAKDWKQSVTLPDKPEPADAGGRTPLSEPESKAIAAYLEKQRPRLVMSFHSQASIVEANEVGDSPAIAGRYAQQTGYTPVTLAESKTVFLYDTTGAMEDWLRDGPGHPAILVELASSTDSEFARNKDALWRTVSL